MLYNYGVFVKYVNYLSEATEHWLGRKMQMKRFWRVDCITLINTRKCNSRCMMCNIWKMKSTEEITPQDLKNLANSEGLKECKAVSILGGESFLSANLPEVCAALCKYVPTIKTILISSNGFATKLIADSVRKIRKKIPSDARLEIHLSLDGPGKIHDKIRGIPGGYSRVMKTVKLLRKEKLADKLLFNFTFMAANAKYYKDVVAIADKMGIEFAPSIFYSSEYFGNIKNRESLAAPKAEVLKFLEFLQKRAIEKKSPFDYGTWHAYIRRIKHEKINPCYAGFTTVFITPDGNVYPCQDMIQSWGNLKKQKFDDIWFSEKANKERKIIAANKCKCPSNYMGRCYVAGHFRFVPYSVLRTKVMCH